MPHKTRETYPRAGLEKAKVLSEAILGLQGHVPPRVLKLAAMIHKLVVWHLKNSTGHHSPSGGPGKPPAST